MTYKVKDYMDIMPLHPEVSGTCNLCVLKLPNDKTIKFLLDCGLFQERPYNKYNETLEFNEESIDFVLVTHNHIDHTGRLPMLFKNGYYKDVYCTELTKELMKPALEDTCGILNSNCKWNPKKKPIYEQRDVDTLLNHLKAVPYGHTFQPTSNISVTFFQNGHLLGAAIILVQIHYEGYNDINLIFTGDYAASNVFFDVEQLPKWVTDLDITIVQESTYGMTSNKDIQYTFDNLIEKAIFEGKSIVSTAFSLGRFQEILLRLKKLQQIGKLSTNIPIYIDGKLALRYNNIYQKNRKVFKESARDFIPKNCITVSKNNRNEILKSTSQKMVITTSGMGSYGPAQTYIPEYIERPNTLIIFNGYMAEGTLGRKLQDAKQGEEVTLSNMTFTKKAKVCYTNEFSAHAKQEDLLLFLKQFKNLKSVLINHGEYEVKDGYSKVVKRVINPKYVVTMDRDYFTRITPFGYEKEFHIKTIPTKFL